jgi:hypothetical protein
MSLEGVVVDLSEVEKSCKACVSSKLPFSKDVSDELSHRSRQSEEPDWPQGNRSIKEPTPTAR